MVNGSADNISNSMPDADCDAIEGTVLPPCQIKCPIHEDIQKTNVMISLLPTDMDQARQKMIDIGDLLHEHNPMFTICGYVCGICERECNYDTHGGSIRRRQLKRFLSDEYMKYLPSKPELDMGKGPKKVAVIGGGPGGLVCAWELRKKGHDVTIFEASEKLGGAMGYIPKYRLPTDVLMGTVNELVRIGSIEVNYNYKPGEGNPIEDLRQNGFDAFYVATGTTKPRTLTYKGQMLDGHDLQGVGFGLDLLGQSNMGQVPEGRYNGKKVIVIGGGNVAFDAARTVVRYGADVTLICLECDDKCSKDGIPADVEEIEEAQEEGIDIIYSRGVRQIKGADGAFKGVECPSCTCVFDEHGFNPQFDESNVITVDGDELLITVGQMSDRTFLANSGLLNEQGRLVVDPLTLQSEMKDDVFVGGDVRRVGYIVNAMSDAQVAAETISKFLSGEKVEACEDSQVPAEVPDSRNYRPSPELHTVSADDRKRNFEQVESSMDLEEAISEARRCLYCGPCGNCNACVDMELREEVPAAEVNEDLCSGCGICLVSCAHSAVIMEDRDGMTVSVTDEELCKGCGKCVASCPAGARTLPKDEVINRTTPEGEPRIAMYSCRFGWGYAGKTGDLPVEKWTNLTCLGSVNSIDLFKDLSAGIDGILLLGCPPGDCHFQNGESDADNRHRLAKDLLTDLGVDPTRIKIVLDRDPTGGSIKEHLDKMKSDLASLPRRKAPASVDQGVKAAE